MFTDEEDFKGLPWRKLDKNEIDVSNVYVSNYFSNMNLNYWR